MNNAIPLWWKGPVMAVVGFFFWMVSQPVIGNDLDAYLARVTGIQGVEAIQRGDAAGVSDVQRAAVRGDRLAAYNLGVAYSSGRVTGAPDPEKAAYWYRRAARKGSARAAYNLGALYANGRLRGHDSAVMAARWMRVASRRGHNMASVWLYRNDGGALSAGGR